MEISKAEIKYAIPCGVCNELIELNEWEAKHTTFRLCSECVKAVKWARLQMSMNLTNHISFFREEDDGR